MAQPSILAIGAPMVGKSTILKRIAQERAGYFYVSTGDLLRDFVTNNPDHRLTRLELAPMFAGGTLASDDTTCYVTRHALDAARIYHGLALQGKQAMGRQLRPDDVLLLDGVIRKLSQMGFVEKLDLDLRMVVYFDDAKIPATEWERRRVQRGRDHETREVIASRFARFREETYPLVDAYRARGMLRVVDAYPIPVACAQDEERCKQMVYARTLAVLEER